MAKKRVTTWDEIQDLDSTADVKIPSDPLDRVLGQEDAIKLAKIAAIQRRHLLLVGPPGTGKSMIARALSMNIPKPRHEIRVAKNTENAERPFLEILDKDQVYDEDRIRADSMGRLLDPHDVQQDICERLGYVCRQCKAYSKPSDLMCPSCGKSKMEVAHGSNPFGDLLGQLGGMLEAAVQAPQGGKSVRTTTVNSRGEQEFVLFEMAGDKIRMLDGKAQQKRSQLMNKANQKVLVKLDRDPFVLATGASETELLGDVRHDPYGGHEKLGTPAYERVVAGSIHEAHEGVLFVDEISHLGSLQRYILTAMQEKRFPIVGRNPQSAGASVKVENVPCDFILVAACNIQDLGNILSPLRSRIIGGGYEALVDVAMPDTPENRAKYAQFVAQEVMIDGRIPHATMDAVKLIITEGRLRARGDNQPNALTLRLREMGGLIRAAGDAAVMNGDALITDAHIRDALRRSRPVEEQIREKYGSYMKGMSKDISDAQKETSQYYLGNDHLGDQMFN
ncbi:MAG: ATP-binding protein [Candidatus Methanoplasma sp.]|jgi:ATP-dependent Lon protease|nr:ATP-binding protein [Candidatus Methanoplasma sp.]